MQRPSLLGKDPLDALCRHFNVVKKSFSPGTTLPSYFDMPIMRDAHMPSHVFALYPNTTTTSSTLPLMVPVDAGMYSNGFRDDLIPPAIPGSLAPVPYPHPNTGIFTVSLPVVPTSVPHVPSVPLLLLFGLRLETQTNLLALHLLPPQVIEEFPHAAAMAQVMSLLSDAELEQRARYNQGIWQNVLALGVKDTSIVQLIRTAWTVTVEAQRLRR
jgi:hypothetical protein